MIIDDALNMAYSYAATICQDSELCKVSQEFNGLAGETERTYITKSTTITSYSDIQNLLSKLNEKESVRKSKGVYYTPYDVVRFIVINSVKSAYGKLTPENIRREDIDAVPYKSFAAKKTVFDPTCGAGEYLLAALELKLDLLDKHYKRIPITVIHDTVTSIFGNDINTESIMITKLRIVLCILKRYGVDYIVGLAEKMRPNFLTYDYGLDPWHMLETVMLDDEFDVYMAEMTADKRFLFQIFYDQPVIRLPREIDIEAEILFALSYINSCHTLCKKGLKKSLIYREENFTAKLRGKIDVNRNIKHMPFCIPDIIIYDNDTPVAVIDAKYKMSGRPDRSDSHQLLAYVLLTGVQRCGFILPGNKTEVREMITSQDNYLPLAPRFLRYYELLLGSNSDSKELRKVLQ